MTNDYFPIRAARDAMAASIDYDRERRERFGTEPSLEERKAQREEEESRYRRNRAEHFADILATFMCRMTQAERDAVLARIQEQLPEEEIRSLWGQLSRSKASTLTPEMAKARAQKAAAARRAGVGGKKRRTKKGKALNDKLTRCGEESE